MKLLVLALLGFVAAVNALPRTAEWEDWKKLHNRTYPSSVEEQYRHKVWLDNMKYIEEFDSENAGYTVAMNNFGDLTNEEFTERYMGKNPIKFDYIEGAEPSPIGLNASNLPQTVDWRTSGCVTHAKDQGECASCWAFPTTGALETAFCFRTGRLVSLSEQNLIDCVSTNSGCKGGLPSRAYQYIILNHGIDTETSYPYEAKQGYCRFSPYNVGATCRNFMYLMSRSELHLQQAVAYQGTIAVGMDSNGLPQFYKGGVYYNRDCSSTNLNHAVLVVGYGVFDKKTPYWLIKNSWGAGWGLDGYFMLARNRNNHCGVATNAVYPVV